MIDRPDHQIGRAFQRWTFTGDSSRRARFADESAVRLCELVIAIAAQREECNTRRDLAVAFVEATQKRTTAVEFIVEALVPIVDAMVGSAAQHSVADIAGAAVLDEVAHGISAARI